MSTCSSYFFDFQSIIHNLRNKYAVEDKPEVLAALNAIPDDATIGDMNFYKEYLSNFDVKSAFDNYKLAAEDEDRLLDRGTLYLLVQLICSSLSSEYDILYNPADQSIDFSISASNGETMITKKMEVLEDFQISIMFKIYIEEQLLLDILRQEKEEEAAAIDKERAVKLLIFKKKVNLLHKNIEKLEQDKKNHDAIAEDLDALLNE